MKQHVFQVVEKYKIRRKCMGCATMMTIENANRYYCKKCRG